MGGWRACLAQGVFYGALIPRFELVSWGRDCTMSGRADIVVCISDMDSVSHCYLFIILSCSSFSNQPILESGAVELLCGLTQSENPALRVNGIWALMVCFLLMSQFIRKLGVLSKL